LQQKIKCFLVKTDGCGEFTLDAQKWLHANLPPGALWFAPWKKRFGFDGKALYCRLPGGHDWFIDGRCSNCTLPNDTQHRCWVRHGEPPYITVDKNGNTCSAGAGSIIVPNWHGFLRQGYLEQA
jgi:hypothetical protein